MTEDWYFWSHRLPIANAARDAGFDVAVATRIGRHAERIQKEGFKLIPISLIRESRNPFHELRTIAELVRVFKREKPHVIHLVALKPILYGAIASLLGARKSSVIAAIAGMGYLGTSSSVKAKVLRPIVAVALRLLFSSERTRVLVQNRDDHTVLVNKVLKKPNLVRIIKGAGVDTKKFYPVPEPTGTPRVVLASRMLLNKGVSEFVDAVQLLRQRSIAAEFLLVGDIDASSPSAISKSRLDDWHSSGIIKWIGHNDDMASVLRQANIVCLPSYREGLPKVLLEAMASARAIVTTDVPGCREAVGHRINGLLVPVRNSVLLADSLELLITNPQLRAALGQAGRLIAVQEFAADKIGKQTLELYEEVLLVAGRKLQAHLEPASAVNQTWHHRTCESSLPLELYSPEN